MTGINSDRRKFLAASGTALTIAVAGCSGGGDSGGDDGGDDGSSDGGDDGGMGGNVPEEVDTYLNDNDANGYDGSVVDETGSSSVTIQVGAGSDGLAFDPAAVRVDSGTEVTWEWTGNGGSHNVAVNQGPTEFSSETVGEEGHTFSQTLESGNYMYQCDPHATLGMHGAVIVE